ncbi:hypothetical protein [Rhodanobacter sp. MP1X3]|uniref:hypothetical protein n=1 Tax=Rhodanobacter sp. MP1X3 TaxID=2723086 RepID=UPI00160D66D7|nr:hypothetical protein [Rhodanobacter sp. MP1X3]MBB6242711.1 hypothetical protein [Rhodanobacter sp. MP1X3]
MCSTTRISDRSLVFETELENAIAHTMAFSLVASEIFNYAIYGKQFVIAPFMASGFLIVPFMASRPISVPFKALHSANVFATKRLTISPVCGCADRR